MAFSSREFSWSGYLTNDSALCAAKNGKAHTYQAYTKALPKESLSQKQYFCTMCMWGCVCECVRGHEKGSDHLVTMAMSAFLAWFDCQEFGKKKKNGLVVVMVDFAYNVMYWRT